MNRRYQKIRLTNGIKPEIKEKKKKMAYRFRNFSHNFVKKCDQEAICLEEGRGSAE
jgi:hypothetical protein